MITESFYEYKGYTIRLRFVTFVTFNGASYTIIKTVPNISSPNSVKNLHLRKILFYYCEPNLLLSKAQRYIDEFEDKLIKKYNKMKLELK